MAVLDPSAIGPWRSSNFVPADYLWVYLADLMLTPPVDVLRSLGRSRA